MTKQIRELDDPTIVRIANNVAESVRNKFGADRTSKFLADEELAREFMRQTWIEIRRELERPINETH